MGPLGRTLHRAALYKLAAEAFTCPDAALLAQVRDRAARCLHAGAADPAVTAAVGALAAAAAAAEPERLAEEYVRLFDREVRCPPYETAYGDGRRMAGKPAELADVAGFYAAFGLAPSAARPDMEDHVAAELSFMSVIALKEGVALAAGLDEPLAITREAGRRFLEAHLGRFARALASRVKAATAEEYYQAGAALVAALVEAESRRLGVAPRVAEPSLPVLDPMAGDTMTCPFAADSRRPPERAARAGS